LEYSENVKIYSPLCYVHAHSWAWHWHLQQLWYGFSLGFSVCSLNS